MQKTYLKNFENENRVIIKKVSPEGENATKLIIITINTETCSVVSVQKSTIEIGFDGACAALDKNFYYAKAYKR